MKTQPATRGKARILLVDDHPITRDGLALLIAREKDLSICAQAGTAEEALAFVEKQALDLVLTDLSLPDKSGLELIRDLKAIKPALKVLVLSMHDEEHYAERALRAGAAGYIMKVEGGEKLVAAIHHVLAGETYVSQNISSRILRGFTGRPSHEVAPPVGQLSDREFEVFSLLGSGLPTLAIGQRLHISAKTVEAHRSNIKAKLGLGTAAELIAYAARWITGGGGRG